MEGRDNKVAEMFVKDLLALYNTYMLLGVSKLDMCGILINTLAGLYITMAEMNCKIGVKKHLKGGINVNNRDRYLTVYDMKSEGYRNINLNTILEIRCGNKLIKRFVGNTGNIYNLVDLE